MSETCAEFRTETNNRNPPFTAHRPNILPREIEREGGGESNEGDAFGKLHYRRSILMNKGRGGPFDSLRK